MRFALRRSARTEYPAKNLNEEIAALQRATEALVDARMRQDQHLCSDSNGDVANIIDIQDALSQRRTEDSR
jgi:hypothetical protein